MYINVGLLFVSSYILLLFYFVQLRWIILDLWWTVLSYAVVKRPKLWRPVQNCGELFCGKPSLWRTVLWWTVPVANRPDTFKASLYAGCTMHWQCSPYYRQSTCLALRFQTGSWMLFIDSRNWNKMAAFYTIHTSSIRHISRFVVSICKHTILDNTNVGPLV